MFFCLLHCLQHLHTLDVIAPDTHTHTHTHTHTLHSLLLGRAVFPCQSWSLAVKAETPPSLWLGGASGSMVVAAHGPKRKSRNPMNVLDGRADTLWDGGAGSGASWLLFEFTAGTVTLQRMRYTTRNVASGRASTPKLCVLEVGETNRGPWTMVLEWQGPIGTEVCHR